MYYLLFFLLLLHAKGNVIYYNYISSYYNHYYMFLSIDCLYQVLELTQKKPALIPTVDFFDVQVAYVKNSSTQTHTFIFITNNLNYYYISFYYIVLCFIYYLSICNSYYYILPLPQICPQQRILSCVLCNSIRWIAYMV